MSCGGCRRRAVAGALGATARPRRWGNWRTSSSFTLDRLWSGWQDRCPLSHKSPNAPSKADCWAPDAVDPVWPSALLACHFDSGVTGSIWLCWMNKVISGCAAPGVGGDRPGPAGVGLARRPPARVRRPLPDAPWILDIALTDRSRCTANGKGAVVSTTIRTSRSSLRTDYHTYLMAGLRLVMGRDQDRQRALGQATARPALRILDGCPPSQTEDGARRLWIRL